MGTTCGPLGEARPKPSGSVVQVLAARSVIGALREATGRDWRYERNSPAMGYWTCDLLGGSATVLRYDGTEGHAYLCEAFGVEVASHKDPKVLACLVAAWINKHERRPG